MSDPNEDKDYEQRYLDARKRLGLDDGDWHGWRPLRITRQEFDADRLGWRDRAVAGECIEIYDGDERVGGLGRSPTEGELRLIVARDAERIAELEARVRRLQASDGPLLGPRLPPRWPCPKCGGGTWEIFGHDRVCHDKSCGGMIPASEVWGAVERGGEDE